MSNQKNLASHAAAGARVESTLRRAFAAACILTLTGIGVYGAWHERSEWGNVLLALAATLGSATAYAFGYFRCLPDALGALVVDQRGTPWQRWSDFARLSAVVAILVTWIGWVIFISTATLPSGGKAAAVEIVVGAFIMSSLMAACVVASEEYLARNMVPGSAISGAGWRASARRLAGKIGTALAKRLSAKRSVGLGSTLALSSLILMTTVEYGCNDVSHRGYEIVTGKASWISGQSAEGATKVIVEQAGRCTYILGLTIALAALMWVLVGTRHRALRTTRILAGLAAGLALFGVCDYAFAWARFGSAISLPQPLIFVVWIVVWLLPIAIWLKRTRGSDTGAQFTRLAIMVFYLPVLFFCLGMLIFVAPEAPGYILYIIGMLLVWWGLVQSQWEVAGPP